MGSAWLLWLAESRSALLGVSETGIYFGVTDQELSCLAWRSTGWGSDGLI